MVDRAKNGGGVEVPLSVAPNTSWWTRAKQATAYVLTGTPPVWMGPQAPLPPMAQETEGRQLDYPVSTNTVVTPRSNEPISFATLRAFADNYDLLRIIIETRKDQLVRMKWHVVNKDPDKRLKSNDARIKRIEDFFNYPDTVTPWPTWYRMLLEDLFVIDAPTVYIRRTRGGMTAKQSIYALEIVDGATISRKIDANGRTPIPPTTAYQQVIKGMPASDYTADDLIYLPHNPRPNKIYGYSPVEQVLMTVNIAIRRQLHQLEYYTEGNINDLIFGAPETWNTQQIREFQSYWDTLTDTAGRRRARFIPGGLNVTQTREPVLKDQYDEWLARVICFAFSIAPTPFITQVNRATAETSQEVAKAEGLEPLLAWTKAFRDKIIRDLFGYDDLENIWEDEKALDPAEKARIEDIQLRSGAITLNEVRKAHGLEPYEFGDEPLIYTGQGAVLLRDILNPPEPIPTPEPVTPGVQGALPVPTGEEKGIKPEDKRPDVVERAAHLKKKSVERIDRERKAVTVPRAKLYMVYKKFFKGAAVDIANQISKAANLVERIDADELARILQQLDFAGWDVLISPTMQMLLKVYNDGGAVALKQVGIEDAEHLTDLLNERALQYAQKRAAELVGMRNIGTNADPIWIVNPNAAWAITDSTRDMIRANVANAVDEGWSAQHLADVLADNEAFGESRALTIARTEIAFADSAGNMAAYELSGVVTGKEWVKGSEHDNDDECDENEAAGVIPLDEDFPSGDNAAPAHPTCVCDILPVVIEKEEL